MARSRRDKSSSLALFRVLLLTFSLSASLLIAELFIRLVAPQPASWLAIYRRHPTLPSFSLLPNAQLHVDTGETNWTIVTDENGFRINPDVQKTSACSALWLGDSYAFGHGLDYHESFIGVIESQLEDVDVLNASVSGYGPVQYRQTLEYLIEQGLEFDFLVVVSYVGNDFHDTIWDKDQVVGDGVIGDRNDIKSLLMRNLHLYRLAASVYHRFSPQRQPPNRKAVDQLARPEAWDEDFLSEAQSLYETEMRRILELGRNQGAEVAFLILPTRHAVSSFREEDPEHTSAANPQAMLPIQKAGEIFDQIGAAYFDMTPALAKHPPEVMFFQYDGHLTALASAAVADAFREQFSLRCHTAKSAN